MAYITGIASDHINLLRRIKDFVTGKKVINGPFKTGPNAATNGFIRGLEIGASAVNETWTITCTTAGGNGVAVFSVTGSVSLAKASITAGSPYFVTNPSAGIYVPSGAAFTMWGIEAKAVPFAVGDTFTFHVVNNPMLTSPYDERWELLRWKPGIPVAHDVYPGLVQNPNTASGAVKVDELCLRAPGLTEQDNIYINFSTLSNHSSSYYNIEMQGAAAFSADIPGYASQWKSSTPMYMMAWGFEIRYWLIANGRRLIINYEVSGKYWSSYVGLILPYATPSEYPYPHYISGNYTVGTASYTTTSDEVRSFFDPYAGYLYQITSLWKLFQNRYSGGAPTANNVWPFGGLDALSFRESPGGTYPLLPLVLNSSEDGGNVFGELEGAFWVPGFDNQSENVIVVDTTEYLVLQNMHRVGNADFYAVKLA